MIRSLDSTQLGEYRCDRNPDPGRFPDQTTDETLLAKGDYSIVTLEELLDFVATYAESDVKTDEQRENASGLEDRVVIQSFDHRSLWAVHELAPTLVLSALSKGGSVDFDELVERGASIWSSDHNDVTGGRLDAAHQAGLDVIPWTVNEPELMVRLMDLGVDGLITDRPDLLLTIGSDG
jgi:glycerophosphoryl diester phosphodiesterase